MVHRYDDLNILSGTTSLSIEETASLVIGDIESSGTLSIDTIETKFSDHIQVNDNFTVAGNVLANGNLAVDGTLTVAGSVNLTSFLPIKPWAGCEVRMSGTTVTVSQSTGYNTMTALNVIRSAVGVYTISFPPHPYVNNFIPLLVARTANASDFYYPTCKFISPTATTNIVVYMRNGAALIDGDFFFATIP